MSRRRKTRGPSAFRTPVFTAEGLEESRRRIFSRNPWYVRVLLEALDLQSNDALLVVDVGSGTSAYTRLIAKTLRRGTIVSVDRSHDLLAAAMRLAGSEGLEGLIIFVQGDALHLPLPDACADRAFCNTLLWFVPDPIAAVREMARVVRPGGLVVASEPDASMAVFYDPVDPRLAELASLSLRAFTRGARLLWKQDFEIGRRLPELFQLAGLVDIKAYPRFWINLARDFEAEPAESRLAAYRAQLTRLEAQEPETDRELLLPSQRWEQARLAGGMTPHELAEYRERRRRRLLELVQNPDLMASDVGLHTWGGVIARGQRA